MPQSSYPVTVNEYSVIPFKESMFKPQEYFFKNLSDKETPTSFAELVYLFLQVLV